MASRNVKIIVTVVDGATKSLDKIDKKIKQTGKTVVDTTTKVKGFSRALFSATALVGTFSAAFFKLGRSISFGGELDRLDKQFTRVLGSSNKFLLNIRQITDAAIDPMVALKAGIDLVNSGITSGQKNTANFIALSAAAARKAGIDTSKGIKAMIDFAKKGSLSSLELLNLTRTTDAALTSQLEAIKAAGGIFGGTLSIQQKYTIGLRLLQKATVDAKKGQEDLRDVVKLLGTDFDFFKRSVGRFIGTALTPLLKGISDILFKFSLMIENIRKNNKNIVFLTKVIIGAVGAVTALSGAFLTLRIGILALSNLGFGLPKMIFLVKSLGLTFLGLTSSVDTFKDKLELFGGFVKGIFQLVTSLDKETGIAKIDKDLKKLLEDNNLFIFAQNIARAFNVIGTILKDTKDAIIVIGTTLNNIFGGAFKVVLKLLNSFKDSWSKFWISDSLTPLEKFARGAIVILGGLFAGFLGKKLLGGIGTILGKFTPFGGGGGPKGTAADPVHVVFNKPTFGLTSLIPGSSGKSKLPLPNSGGLLGSLKDLFKGKLGKSKGILGGIKNLFSPILKLGTTLIPTLLGLGSTIVNGLVTALPVLVSALGVAAAGSLGVLIGTEINNALFGNKKFGESSNELIQSVFEKIGKFFDGKTESDKTEVINKESKVSTLDFLDILGEQLTQFNDAQRAQAQENIKLALAPDSPGGNAITEEEFKLLQRSFKSAIDESESLKGIRENTAPNNVPFFLRRPT